MCFVLVIYLKGPISSSIWNSFNPPTVSACTKVQGRNWRKVPECLWTPSLSGKVKIYKSFGGGGGYLLIQIPSSQMLCLQDGMLAQNWWATFWGGQTMYWGLQRWPGRNAGKQRDTERQSWMSEGHILNEEIPFYPRRHDRQCERQRLVEMANCVLSVWHHCQSQKKNSDSE